MSPVQTEVLHRLTAVFPAHHADPDILHHQTDTDHSKPLDLLSYNPATVLHTDWNGW